MNYEFTKLGAVEALTEMPENANALVEVNGAIKRVPASAASGSESTGGFDFIIAQNGEGNYTWAKGDHVSFIDRLIDGPPPLVCIYDTNGDHERPSVWIHIPVLIELNSGSGTHCYIRYADERELYVDVNTGDIS